MPTPGKPTGRDKPTIVIVGRANVGKSTLFNKLIEEHKALVSEIAGTTRTVNEGDILWRGLTTHLVDTGGRDADPNVPFATAIDAQTEKALTRAELVLFVADGKVGILPGDTNFAHRVRRLTAKRPAPIFLVANKCDSPKIAAGIEHQDWLKLRFGEPWLVSAASGSGVGDLLDKIYATLKLTGKKPVARPEEPTDMNPNQVGGHIVPLIQPRLKSGSSAAVINVALIGKPNVGKSSLFNKLIGEEKVIVSRVAHTTREPFDTTLEYEADGGTYHITFVDTAGIRRKAKVSGELERAGVLASIDRLTRSDIILLVLDASEPVSAQDLQLGALAEAHSKSVIIVITKWDLVDDQSDTRRQAVKRRVYGSLPHLNFAPVAFTSGLTGYKTHQIFPLIIEVWKARQVVVSSGELDEFRKNLVREHRPARGRGTRHPEILGLRQINVNPPIFEILIKYRTSLHRSYLNFMERKLRDRFGFTGTPIVIKMTKLKR